LPGIFRQAKTKIEEGKRGAGALLAASLSESSLAIG